jgi:hypothetical protein
MNNIFGIFFKLRNANGGVLDARLDTYLTISTFIIGDDGWYYAPDQGDEWQRSVVSSFLMIAANHKGKARLADFRISPDA